MYGGFGLGRSQSSEEHAEDDSVSPETALRRQQTECEQQIFAHHVFATFTCCTRCEHIHCKEFTGLPRWESCDVETEWRRASEPPTLWARLLATILLRTSRFSSTDGWLAYRKMQSL